MTVLLAHRLALVAAVCLVAGFLFLCNEIAHSDRNRLR